MQRACAEEARAGWTLVEKFDNQRLRLKRPISARADDAGREIDPYRTEFGVSAGAVVGIVRAIVFGSTLLIAGAIIGLVFLFVK